MQTPFVRIIDQFCEDLANRIAAKLREPAAAAESNPITAPATTRPENPAEAVPAPTAPATPQQAQEQAQADATRATQPPAAPVKLEQLMLDLVRKIGRDKTIAALAERGVKKASELTGDNLAGFRAWAEDEIGAKNG